MLRYRAALHGASAPLHKAITLNEVTDENITTYCDHLLGLLRQTLEDYDELNNPTSAEAASLTSLIHIFTFHLLTTDTVDHSHITVPASLRQSNSNTGESGYDACIWFQGREGYSSSLFKAYVDTVKNADPALDEGVIIFTPQMLGQSKPAHNFVTSRTLLAEANGASIKPDHHKRLRRTRVAIAKILNKATE